MDVPYQLSFRPEGEIFIVSTCHHGKISPSGRNDTVVLKTLP